MAAHDSSSDQDARLIAAAQAAASWARARRATWTSAPLEVAASETAIPPPIEFEFEPTPPPVRTPASVVAAPSHSHPSDDVPTSTPVRAFGAPAVTWLALAAVGAAVIAVAVVGWAYVSDALPTFKTRSPVAAQPTAGRATAAGRKATGGLRVSSTPTGAKVLVDGTARGVTPLTLTGLTPGRHEVALTSDAGTVRRTVTVAASQTETIEESIFSGWVTVYSPFEVVITEGGRVLRADDRNQVMLAPGTHELRLTNRALGYQAVRKVDVKPGEATNVQVTPGPSTLTVTATEAAQVWVDGARVGETPLNAAPVPLGTHEIVVKSTSGGERRFTVTIGVNPFTLNVPF